MKRLLALSIAILLMPFALKAGSSRFSISTNLLDYVRLATLNVDASYAVSTQWSVLAGARYNPFTFNEDDPQKQFQYRQRSCSLGARRWLSQDLSGWWMAGKVRFQEYNIGGIASLKTEEGNRYGLGIYAGYTRVLSQHVNLEFGVGMWGGMSYYTTYSCPSCGLTLDSGNTWFARPDDVMLSLVYVF